MHIQGNTFFGIQLIMEYGFLLNTICILYIIILGIIVQWL